MRSLRGHSHSLSLPVDGEGSAPMSEWEALVVDAVGNTIDFWRFKRNHGRVWALLYLRDRALSAAELQDVLGLSKGAASMVTREVEQWGVVRRVRAPGDATWRFVAETDLLAMVRRVIESRELPFVVRVREDLEDALALAKKAKGTPRAVVDRIERMTTLATLVDKALRAFVRTSRLDVAQAASILRTDAGAAARAAR